MANPGKTLYLCYFWLDTPLVQTQVLPYLREIKKGGTEVHLLTFERDKLTKEQIESNRKSLAQEGIHWDFLTYHKRPSAPATLYDVLCGVWYTWKKIRKEKIDILHGRIHIPTMMAVIAKKFSFGKKPKVLFDIRGFMPEEYTDAGIWKENGLLYKAVKKIEKWLLDESDGFVVLTEKARGILFPESKNTGYDKRNRPVEVIPCCPDLRRFESVTLASKELKKSELGLKYRFVVAYVGSFGGWYLTEAMADFWKLAKEVKPDTFALVITQGNPEMIRPLLEARGFTKKDYLIKKVLPEDIANLLSSSDVAISFIKPCYSKLASSPTKNAEYLACGIPMIANSGIGDTDEMTLEDNVGVIIKELTPAAYRGALVRLDKLLENRDELAKRCKDSADKRFHLEEIGGKRYRSLYQKLLSGQDSL